MSDDLIKRSDAIKSLDNAWINGTGLLDANEAIKQLNDLPPADRLQGKWIIEKDVNGNTYGRCSICGMRQYAGQLNYCSDCGSRMKGLIDEKECHKPESQYYRAYCEEWKDEVYCDGCKFWY